jgi:hypothetical protein
MNINGKLCIICIDLLSDIAFGALEYTYFINTKTKKLFNYRNKTQASSFLKDFHDHNNQIVNPIPSTTF